MEESFDSLVLPVNLCSSLDFLVGYRESGLQSLSLTGNKYGMGLGFFGLEVQGRESRDLRSFVCQKLEREDGYNGLILTVHEAMQYILRVSCGLLENHAYL